MIHCAPRLLFEHYVVQGWKVGLERRSQAISDEASTFGVGLAAAPEPAPAQAVLNAKGREALEPRHAAALPAALSGALLTPCRARRLEVTGRLVLPVLRVA